MKIVPFVLILGVIGILAAGCLDVEPNPVVGTWEWTDGKDYAERYTFHANHTFRAEALGSVFIGTWEEVSPGRYQVTYWNADDPGRTQTFSENVIYDEESEQIYYPGHRRIR